MVNVILQIFPILLLLFLYLFIFTRKREVQRAKESFKGYDWLTFIGITLASVVLASTVSDLGLNIPQSWLIAILGLFFLFLIVVVVRRAKAGKAILKQIGDERINAIYSKSARNGLFVTYLTFFLHSVLTDATMLDTTWLAITLADGLAVIIGSMLFYYYGRSF